MANKKDIDCSVNITHYQRCKISPQPKLIHKYVHRSFTKENIKDEKLCRVIPVSKEVVVDNRETLRQLHYTDFSIENLQVSGAIDNLTDTTLHGDTVKSIANLEKHAESIINNPDSYESKTE